MAVNIEKYDSALLSILQSEGKIQDFLEVIFGFLYRRTDYYRILHSKEDKMGFPPGTASTIAFNGFRKYEEIAKKDREAETVMLESGGVPGVARQVEVQSSAPKPKPVKKDITLKDSTVKIKDAAEKAGDPESVQKVYQANPDSYNGAVRDDYSWSQTINEIDIRVQVPKNVVKGRQAKVDIQKKRLKAAYVETDGNLKTIIDSELVWPINKEESLWTLMPGDHIHVHLEKVQERWWEGALVEEPKIDVQKIDASRPMSDLDDEAQSKIGEMMYNEEQKRLGLPQSHEQKTHDLLKKAWDCEGSPFRGTPFDPSKVNCSPSGGAM